MIIAFDLSSRKCGYCVGDGSSVPHADAFILDQHGEDIGAMLAQLDDSLAVLFDKWRPTLCAFEAPILPSGGKGDKGPVMGSLLTRRKLMNVAGHLEYFCHRRGIPYGEENVRTIKKELAGHGKASKADMVYAAQKCGVRLPATQAGGMEDAADAFGIWLLGLRHTNKALSAQWDRKLWSARGGLI